MRFDVITVFPELFAPFLTTGVLGRAISDGTVAVHAHDLRQWAENRWRKVDDEPYGGGAGMVIEAPPVLAAVRALATAEGRTVLLTPRGRPFCHQVARELADEQQIVLVCGRYEGVDERVSEILAPDEISIGDFVLGGGETAAMVIIEAVSRLIPGVVGDPASVEDDSFVAGLLDSPCYTRPASVEGSEVPSVLLSGHHEAVRLWRLERAVRTTVTRRPDLIKKHWGDYPADIRRLVRRWAPDLVEDM